MSTYLTDTFTIGSGSSNLVNHTADTGQTWTAVTTSYQYSAVLSGDGCIYKPSTPSIFVSSLVPPVADYLIQTTVDVKSILASDVLTLYARYQDANDFYYATITQAGVITLYKAVSGSGTTLGNSVTETLTAGSTYAWGLQVQGPTITVIWNGAAIITVTDTTYTTAGSVALRSGGGSTTNQTSSTGIQMKGFSVQSVGGITAPSAPTLSLSTSNGTDTISYTASTAGTNSVAGVALYSGTSAGGESGTPLLTNSGSGAGSFSRPTPTSGTTYYVVKAYDSASTPNYSAASNEVQSSAPGAAIYLNDTFTGSSGTALVSHTSDSGATWSTSGTTTANELSGDGFVFRNAAPSPYISNASLPANYEVDLKFETKSMLASDIITVYARLVDSADFYYTTLTQAGLLTLYKAVSNTPTILALANCSVASGVEHTISMIVNATTIEVLWDGLNAINITDSTYTAGGSVGIKVGGSSTTSQSTSTGLQIDSIIARSIPTVVTAPTIGVISLASSSGTDTITYPAPVAGANPVAGAALYVGTASGGENFTPVATNSGTGAGSFTYATETTGMQYYVVRSFDNASLPNYSAVSNEVYTRALPTIYPDDAGILYSPYNWSVPHTDAETLNAGAYFKTVIVGSPTAINLWFNLASDSPEVPEISYRIDQSGWMIANIAASVALAIPANGWTKHTVEVVVKTTPQSQNRWTSPIATLVDFQGIATTPTSCTTSLPTRKKFNGLVLGDSITEGVRTIYGTAQDSVDVDGADATQGYAWRLAENMGAEIGCVGFSHQGIITTGVPDVPVFTTTYNQILPGVTRSFTTPAAPDFIIINQGTNDNSANGTGGDITAGYESVLSALLTSTPSTTLICCVVPFNQNRASDILTVVTTVNSPRVKLVSTSGWFNSGDTSDGLHPYGYQNVNTLAPLLAQAVRTLLGGGASYIKKSDGTLKQLVATRV